MKRILICAVCAMAAAISLTACGGNASGNPTAAPTVAPTAAPTVEPTAEPTIAPTAEPTAAPTVEPTAVQEDLPLICRGVFEYWLRPEGYDPYWNFIHFYPNGVFYASQYSGSSFAAGFYEVADEPFAYTDKEGNAHNAPQTVRMTLVDGTEYETVGYEADKGLIGLVKAVFDNVFTQNLETGHTAADENGVALIEYMLGEDDYSLLRFMHNGTFQDTIGPMIEGVWSKDGDTYSLTDGETGETYTFTANADYTGTYKGLGGSTETLNLIREAEVSVAFSGIAAAAYGEMTVTVSCFDGGKAVMNTAYAGRDIKAEGTWALAADYSAINLTIDGVDYSAPRDPEDNSFTFEYAASDGGDGVAVVMSTKDPVTTLYTFTGEGSPAIILECYSDGSCALIYTGMGTVTEGMWAMDTSGGPLPKWTVELNDTFEGQGVTVEADAEKFFFAFKDASGRLEETLILPYSALR